MSERLGPSADDDAAFDALTAQLFEDKTFAQSIGKVNDEMDVADLLDRAPRLVEHGQTRAYHAESLDDVAAKVHGVFVDLCEAYDIDVNTVLEATDDYGDINEILALAVCKMKDRVHPGDTIAASCALVVDLRGEDAEAMAVIGIGADEKVVGTFVSPTIGPMPDEAHALAGDGKAPVPLGMGIMLRNVAIIDEYGVVHENAFEGATIVVALGTSGLHLEKFHYFDDDNL